MAAAGLADRIEIRAGDYRDLAGEQFDAIASTGMVEHVGSANIDTYTRQLAAVLRPGGRLLNHGIARLRYGDPEAGPFSERFVFPDAAPLHLSRVLAAIETAGLEPKHVEAFRHDYARTLREWARNLDEHAEHAESLAGPERMRVWRLYLRAARRGFETASPRSSRSWPTARRDATKPTPPSQGREPTGGTSEPADAVQPWAGPQFRGDR